MASGRSRPPKSLKIATFGNTKDVFKFDTKVTDCTVHLAVTGQKLNGTQVSGFLVYQSRLGAPTPLKLVSAGQADATSPAPLAGAVAQQTAEGLAGLVYANLLSPGHPALFRALPIVSDLRTGAMSGGSAKQGILMAVCAQMTQHYGIPCAVSAGMTDARCRISKPVTRRA